MNDLSIVFENNPVRNVFQDGEWWFCAKDIGEILGLTNVRQEVAKLSEENRGVFLAYTPSSEQRMIFVNEIGLYELIFKSTKPAAKDFKTYVFNLVKSHRKGEILTLEQVNAALEHPGLIKKSPEPCGTGDNCFSTHLERRRLDKLTNPITTI